MVEFLLQIIDNLDVAFSVLLNRALAATPVILAACLYRVLLRKRDADSQLFFEERAGRRTQRVGDNHFHPRAFPAGASDRHAHGGQNRPCRGQKARV